ARVGCNGCRTIEQCGRIWPEVLVADVAVDLPTEVGRVRAVARRNRRRLVEDRGRVWACVANLDFDFALDAVVARVGQVRAEVWRAHAEVDRGLCAEDIRRAGGPRGRRGWLVAKDVRSKDHRSDLLPRLKRKKPDRPASMAREAVRLRLPLNDSRLRRPPYRRRSCRTCRPPRTTRSR